MSFILNIYRKLRSFLQYHFLLFTNLIVLGLYLTSSEINYNTILLLLISYLLAGIGAYLVNDFYDRKSDSISKKLNLTIGKSNLVVWIIIITSWLVSLICIYTISIIAFFMLLLQFGLLVAYSIPFIRLKENPVLSIIIDMLYAHVIPLTIILILFNSSISDPIVLLLVSTVALIGIKDILLHQLADKQNDELSETKTFALSFPNIIQPLLKILNFLTLLALYLFIFSIDDLSNNYFILILLTISFLCLAIVNSFNLKYILKNNSILRFYILLSSLLLSIWVIDIEHYFLLLLLLHPYIFQFIIQLKNYAATLFNYFLYFLFRAFGRNLKENPLYKKNEE